MLIPSCGKKVSPSKLHSAGRPSAWYERVSFAFRTNQPSPFATRPLLRLVHRRFGNHRQSLTGDACRGAECGPAPAQYGVGMGSAATSGVTVVPANEASWEDLETVFGARGDPSRCFCQRYKMSPGESWASVGAEELAFRLREQTDCGHRGPR